MHEITYTILYDNIGIYKEDGGQALLAVIPGQSLERTITFAKAAADAAVSFVFTARMPQSAEDARHLLRQCQTLLEQNHAVRGVLWLHEQRYLVLPMSENNSYSTGQFCTVVSGTQEHGISVSIWPYAKFLCADGKLKLTDRLKFSFADMQVQMAVHNVWLDLCGPHAGILFADVSMSGYECSRVFPCGFEYGYRTDDSKRYTLISSRLFQVDSFASQTFHLCFQFGFHVFSENSIRFQKTDQEYILLSNFISLYGDPLFLSPVTDGTSGGGMVFLPRISENIICAPVGAYRISMKRNKQIQLLCGFCGTEYFTIENGGLVEFAENQPAFCAGYPRKEFSIEDFVKKQPLHLLTDELVTTGMVFYGKYCSQPQNAPFFCGSSPVMPPAELYTDFMDGSPMLPVVPYQQVRIHVPDTDDAWAKEEDISAYEQQILASERTICCQKQTEIGVRLTDGERLFNHMDTEPILAATPSGFIGELRNDRFCNMTVAFSPGGNVAFTNAAEGIVSAFLDSSMFCVFANDLHIGQFQNTFTVEDWRFHLTPGAGSSYNCYANILIIKAAAGKIYDPDDYAAGLCTRVGSWTCRDLFSVPKCGEASNLAAWISDYCKKAYGRYLNGEEDFRSFAQIITDENWKGILALNVSLEASCFPDCLQPLLVGMNDMSLIRAHHIGAQLVQLKATDHGPVNDGYSPFFGLITYTADGYTDTALPISDPQACYEFKLLKLKVIFEKGMVKDLKSVSQLVLGELLALSPSSEGCLYHALLLNGTMQQTSGGSVLLLDSDGGTYCFLNAPIQNIVITAITMETTDSKKGTYTFHLSGSLSFYKPDTEQEMDLFSYDKLCFTDYRLSWQDGSFSADASKMVFDLPHSVLRGKSIGSSFRIVPKSVSMGESVTEGFRIITTAFAKTAKSLEGKSAGILFSVKLGGLGSLSNGDCLLASMLLAWDGEQHTYAGLMLPGAAMIDGVVSVTFGDAVLTKKDDKPVLYISGVCLQLLGLLKLPANGALRLAMEGCEDGIGWLAAYQP